MNLLRNAWLDIAVTALIGIAILLDNEPARWAVMVYTPIMVLLKLAAFSGRHSPSRIRAQDAGVPLIVYHILYGANLAMLVYGSIRVSDSWWWVTAAWAIIWLLSAATGKGKPVRTSDVGGRTSEV